MDTKKLRQKILDLAIRGKLVPQDPNDEPASVLLERIRAEKQQLIKEGKIKMPKGSKACDTSHYEKIEGPFEIPESWEWCLVDDFAYVATGSTPSKDSFVENGIPYIKMYNLRNQKIDFSFHPQYIKEDVHKGKLKRSRTEVGDLIMNIVGPPLGKLAFIPPSLPESNFNQAAVLLRPLLHKEIINRWLFFYLSEMSEINSISTKGSAGQVNISLTQSQNMRIPMPPLAEQIRICSEIEKLWQYLDCIDTSSVVLGDTIENVKSKILDLAIQGKLVPQDPSDEPAIELLKRINPDYRPCDNSHYPFEIPDSWSLSTFGQLNNHQSKTINPLSEPEKTFELYSVPIFETGKPEILKGIEIGSTKQLVHKGEVLVCKINPHLNRVWVVEHYNTQMNCIASSEWIVFQHPALLPRYALLYFQSPYFRERLLSNVSGVGGSLMRARPSAVDGYFVPIPPINEQRRIVQAVDKLYDNLSSISNFL